MASKRIDQKNKQMITRSRIISLYRFAESQAKQGYKERTRRYMTLIRRLSTKNRTPIPKEWKHRMCKHCHQFLIPGDNCRIRIHRGKIIVFCENCSQYYRIPLKKK